jgi:hypothetical protein
MKVRYRATFALVLTATAAFLCPPVRASAEDLRTIVAGTASLSADASDGVRLSLAYNEAVSVVLPKDSSYIQGFEIEIKIPPAAQAMPGALAYELWRRVDPAPDKNRYGYEGERIITQALPARASLVIQVPVRKDHNLKSGPYATVIPAVVEAKDFPFLFKFYPISKGIPAELENAQFQVRIRPLLTDEGGLRLSIHYPEAAEKAAIVVSVDDKRLSDARYLDGREALVLKAGTHYLRVSSEQYRDESRTFTIEQGRTLDLVIDLQDTAPLVMVEAPDSAQVSIDGKRLTGDLKVAFTVDVGEHVVACRIGDYTVTRRFTAFRGKTYKIVLSVDLQVQESP